MTHRREQLTAFMVCLAFRLLFVHQDEVFDAVLDHLQKSSHHVDRKSLHSLTSMQSSSSLDGTTSSANQALACTSGVVAPKQLDGVPPTLNMHYFQHVQISLRILPAISGRSSRGWQSWSSTAGRQAMQSLNHARCVVMLQSHLGRIAQPSLQRHSRSLY